MQQIKLLLLGLVFILAMGCSEHDHSDQGHSHDKTPNKHESIN